MTDNVNYIIVQAGGKGTRMEKLTINKPKALVPVNNLPMIFHLFKKYPNKKYIIIGDYKYEVLDKYLNVFASVDYQMVSASGTKGTCGGLKQALSFIPERQRFMLIWCDLILPQEYELPISNQNVIGISKDFPCRWKYENGKFEEERSIEHGVAGHFIFRDKMEIIDVPEDGEFVRWLQSKNMMFDEQSLCKTKEYGVISEWNKLPTSKCRPFNSLEIIKDRIVKKPLDEQGIMLAKRECAWYKKVQALGISCFPKIYSFEPLTMEYVKGKNLYELSDDSFENKDHILKMVVECLDNIHSVESVAFDRDSYYEAYIGKTWKRLEKIKNLVPFANDEYIVVNGVRCKNVFFIKDEIEKAVMGFAPGKFVLLHGDCTFSNIMVQNDGTPLLIDPRGYFGNTEYYGDENYDWVKLYYSLFSNYDQFNLKHFELRINGDSTELNIESNNWEKLENTFLQMISKRQGVSLNEMRRRMKLLLAIIWLSLTTYAWEDYDSICGAFYNGLLYLHDAMKERE